MLKEKDLRVVVSLLAIKTPMKKEAPHRKGDQKIRQNNIGLGKEKILEIFVLAINIKLY